MKKMGRLFYGLLIAVLLIVPSTAMSVTLTITSASAAPSDIIQMEVLTNGFTDVAGVQIFIDFDTDKLDFHSMATSHIQSWTTNVDNGRIYVIWDNLTMPLTLPNDEPLFQFNLQAKSGAIDSAKVEFGENIQIVNNIGDPIAIILEDAIIDFIPTAVGDYNGAIPGQFELQQNFPNPFNPTTNISYSISRSGDFSIEIYNISGQLIKRIDLGHKTPGTYSFIFSGDKMASGVYTYRLLGDIKSVSKQMILLK